MNKSKRELELETLTSSLVPTPANLLVSQASKKAKKIQDTSGQTLLELSKSASPLGSLEKTLVDTLNSVSTPFLRTWRVKVTTQGHLLFQLHPSAHGIKGKESGLSDIRQWPTPAACEMEGGVSNNVEFQNGSFSRKNKKGVRYGVKLKDAVHHMERMYPTPKARDYQGAEGKRVIPTEQGWSKERDKSKVRYGASLNDVVEYQQMYPTPRANEPGRTTKGYGRGLAELMEGKQQMYPTPAARDYKDSTLSPASMSRNSDSLPTMMMKEERQKVYATPTVDDSKVVNPKPNRRPGLVSQVNAEQSRKTGGKLNPNFVEFLMGFPMDWTKVESEESKD